MLTWLQRVGQAGFGALQTALAAGFDGPSSPLKHLGSLTIYFFWIVLVSGIWLLLFFETSVGGAYESVEYLTHDQWYLGGVMRSLHRYASDAAIVTVLLHIGKEFAFDRYRGKGWFSWITGVPLLWLVLPLGITGYWLVWDELGQYVALSSAELLDGLPIFTDSMASNFLSDASLSDRFFTLMAFLHLIGLPLFLVFGIWLHVFRMTAPRINPPRTLMAGSLLAMLVVSLAFPALSQGPADLARMPDSIGMDWYYLLVYPLIQHWSPNGVWLLLTGLSALLVIAPWLPPAAARPVAVVDLDNCNGCERCVADCPYDAVSLVPRTDGKAYASQAEVNADLCVSCGICVGACPTATPFRTRSALVPGIDLPELSAAQLRETVDQVAARMTGSPRVLVLTCEGSATSRELGANAEGVMAIRCMAQLPPPFVDYVLSRGLADGVFFAGCADGDCRYRLGADWIGQRIDRRRDPFLRKRVDARRVALAWRQPWSRWRRAAAAVGAFRTALADEALANKSTADTDATAASPPRAATRARRLAVVALAWMIFSLPLAWLSKAPAYRLLAADQSVVSLSFSHAGQRLEACRTLTQEQLNALPPNMRTVSDCPRERRPIAVSLTLDGKALYDAVVPPSGIWSDGESNVYQRFKVTAGSHRLHVGMRDSDRTSGFDYERELEVALEPGQHLLVNFDNQQRVFVIR